jgi:ElaB/YqjD/DUF883 family membrane-anchored ribosome-binding protein
MTPATVDAPELDKETTVGGRMADACRQAAHLSHEAQRLKSVAADAVDDGVHAARRAIESVRRGVEDLGDLKDEAVHRVTRQPLTVLSVGIGVGLVLGLAIGWIGKGPRQPA